MAHDLIQGRKARRWLSAVVLSCCLWSHGAAAQDEERHLKVEAAYLYNFFNYITWPGFSSPRALEDPVICIAYNDPVESYLDYVKEKMAGERTLTVRRMQEGENIDGCNLLFMRSGLTPRMAAESLRQNVLLVSEPEDSLERGGMIELLPQEERLIIIINQTLLSKHGFQVSSRLLDLAHRIK